MVGTSNEELQRQSLEAEREKLTEEQRKKHDQFCDLLKANDTFTPETALEAVRIIATEEGLRRTSELRHLAERSDRQALEEQHRAQAEADQQAQRADQQRLARDQEAARLAAQESEQLERAEAEREANRIAAHEAARREPIPGSIDRFDATLASAQAQRHEASIERLAETRGDRPNYNRFDKLKAEQAEHSGLAGKGYDDMYTPRPNGGAPRHRGGRSL